MPNILTDLLLVIFSVLAGGIIHFVTLAIRIVIAPEEKYKWWVASMQEHRDRIRERLNLHN